VIKFTALYYKNVIPTWGKCLITILLPIKHLYNTYVALFNKTVFFFFLKTYEKGGSLTLTPRTPNRQPRADSYYLSGGGGTIWRTLKPQFQYYIVYRKHKPRLLWTFEDDVAARPAGSTVVAHNSRTPSRTYNDSMAHLQRTWPPTTIVHVVTRRRDPSTKPVSYHTLRHSHHIRRTIARAIDSRAPPAGTTTPTKWKRPIRDCDGYRLNNIIYYNCK